MQLLYFLGFAVPSVVFVVKVTPSLCVGFVVPVSGAPVHLMRKFYAEITLCGIVIIPQNILIIHTTQLWPMLLLVCLIEHHHRQSFFFWLIIHNFDFRSWCCLQIQSCLSQILINWSGMLMDLTTILFHNLMTGLGSLWVVILPHIILLVEPIKCIRPHILWKSNLLLILKLEHLALYYPNQHQYIGVSLDLYETWSILKLSLQVIFSIP